MSYAIGHVNIGIMWWKSLWRLYNTQSKSKEFDSLSKSDSLFKTQSRVLQDDWLILENNKKATLNINMPFSLEPELCEFFIWGLYRSHQVVSCKVLSLVKIFSWILKFHRNIHWKLNSQEKYSLGAWEFSWETAFCVMYYLMSPW